MIKTGGIRRHWVDMPSDQNLYKVTWYNPGHGECNAYVFATDRLTAERVFAEYMSEKYGYKGPTITYVDVEFLDAEPNAVLDFFVDYDSTREAAEFLDWCSTPMYRPEGNLGFQKRVVPQFPEYNTYVIINEEGKSILPKSRFLTAEEVYKYWVKSKKQKAKKP